MLDKIYNDITNSLYSVSAKVLDYIETNPNQEIITASAAKARKLDHDEELKSSIGWATARRDTLILTNQKLVCGNWEILLEDIDEAKLLRVKRLFSKFLTLKIATNDGIHYQFGLQYDPVWEEQDILALQLEDSKIKQSPFLILYKIVVWGLLIYGLYYVFSAMYQDFAALR